MGRLNLASLRNMEKNMFDRILLPLDISEMPEIVVPYAEELAGKFASEIILYYVRAKDHEELKNLTLDYLDRVAETIKQHILNNEKKELTITTKIAEGEPAQSICELVNKNKIDLIIMPSVSVSGLKIGKILGSVTDHVCHTVPIPILLIKPQHAQLTTKRKLFNNILIPLDGSELSKLSLPVGEEVAAKLKIPIVLFEMAPMVYPSANSSNMYGTDYVKINDRDEQVIEYNYAKANEAEESRVQAELIAIERELRGKGLSVDHRITSGIDAAKEIVQICKEKGVDLIIMSTRGRSGVNRWLLGSVTEKVLHFGEVPLLLINARAG
jgi:nucleotide-binding universal stress UspA family protein